MSLQHYMADIRWLLIKGREEESLATLARLHARGDINDAFVRGEFEEMKSKLRVEAESQATWSQVGIDNPPADLVALRGSDQSAQANARNHASIFGPVYRRQCTPVLCSKGLRRNRVQYNQGTPDPSLQQHWSSGRRDTVRNLCGSDGKAMANDHLQCVFRYFV